LEPMDSLMPMKIIALALLTLLTACASSGSPRPSIPTELQAAVAVAESDGAALFEAAALNRSPEPDQERQARSGIVDFCDFKYRAVAVNANAGPAIYFVGQPRTDGEVVFGRHFKVQDGNVAPSTKTCLAFPPPPDNAVGLFITHLLSPSPSDFHVYVSLATGKPVYVGTGTGNWIVEKGKISFLQKR
jgi:hypothetical protein